MNGDPETWIAVVDSASGQTYYRNSETGACQWTLPAAKTDENWWEMFDEERQLPYYYNSISNVTSWELPAGATSRKYSESLAEQQAASTPVDNEQKETNSKKEKEPIVDTAQEMLPTQPKKRKKRIRVLGRTPRKDRPKSKEPSKKSPGSPKKVYTDNAEEPAETLPANIKVDIGKFRMEDYARRYFDNHKKGIFRRTIPLQNRLQFQKDALKHPLLRLPQKSGKTAVEIFKLILMYQGVKQIKNASSVELVAQQILSHGLIYPEVRDEIFCQLCKQSNKCPDPTTELRSWELIVFCCYTFPPTKDFEDWLRHYCVSKMKDKKSKNKQTKCVADYSYKKLNIICKSGPKGKVPSVEEIKLLTNAPFCGCPFGSSLKELMEAQKHSFSQLLVPRILTVLSDSVLRLGGCSNEGIFRVPGDIDKVNACKIQLEVGNYAKIADMTCEPSVPASLLKLWLRELPEPVIPTKYYAKCLDAVDDPQKSVSLVSKLPKLNKRTLCYVIHFLQVVAEKKNIPKTKMTPENLAMVFAPNLLVCTSDSPRVIFENSKREQVFVKNLVLNMRKDMISS
eukprot:TRINITY_DN2013_c0_g1_i1.p1 TRINITY_DN2013_c0_g1~~TRINITY_DN2013_c0_g1_i1.p1  ORF type:complete len:567 (-),score=64.60 TRINITY_DN2013_c0_g1_i1:93-1793(-)